jgi:ABC-2 type transport system permease protein
MNIGRIARHEIRQAWRARVVPLLALLLMLLLAGAAAIGHARASADEEQRHRYQEMVAAQWKAQPDRHPHRVAHYGFLVFRPKPPLAFFDTGVESYTGTSLFLEAHRQNSANFSDATQADGTRRFGELTMAMVLQLFVPLLLFVIAGVAVTREREAGTLSLVLCQGVSWAHVLWGKALGALWIVTALVLPGLLAAGLWLVSSAAGSWSPDSIARAGLLALSHAAYFIVCALAAVVVSARHRTSRGALVTLITLWIALWVVLPRALPSIAVARDPLPSRAAFEADVERRVRALGDSHNPDDPNFARLRQETLARHGVTRVEDLPFNYNGVVMREGEALTSDAYREHVNRLLAVYARHGQLVHVASVLSPFVAIRTASMALAGVDVPHAVEFERQAEAYRYELIQELNELHTHEVDYAWDRYVGFDGGGAPTRQRIGRDHFHAIPTFDYREPPVWWAVQAQSPSLLALILWLCGVAAALAALGRRSLTP